MNNGKKKFKKVLFSILGVVGACALLFGAYVVIYSINTKPETAASTAENCEVLHNLYLQEEEAQRGFKSKFLMDWDEYRDETLYNLGLADHETTKRWNGTWIIDEEFIRTYITKYSAEEFMDMYKIYAGTFTTPWVLKFQDETFYDENPALLTHISETTKLMFEMTDVFKVANCRPTVDTVLNKTSETEKVTGSFNVGSDNHIESQSDTRTTDTYEYDGYTVKHIYGSEYDGGQYGWVNGEFVDIKPHFDSVNKYYLYENDRQLVGPVSKMEELECKWLIVGDERYYEWVVKGGQKKYDKYTSSYARFEEPVSILTTDSYDLSDAYIQYED